MYYQAERLATYRQAHPDWLHKPMILVPDLTVEVISSHDLYSEIQNKVETYLSHGVQYIWLIDPYRQKATTYQGENSKTLSREDSLSGEELLPEFALPLLKIFP